MRNFKLVVELIKDKYVESVIGVDGVELKDIVTKTNDAYKKLIKSDPKNNFQLAELSLWKGISLNENLDIKNEIKRNDRAIKEYEKGMEHLKKLKEDEIRLIMSLNNSLGVAYHHKDFSHIPEISYKYYKKAYNIYKKNKDDKKIKEIMKKVEYNSGFKYKL